MTRQPTPGTHKQPSEAYARGFADAREAAAVVMDSYNGRLETLGPQENRYDVGCADASIYGAKEIRSLLPGDHTPTAPAGEATVSEAEVGKALALVRAIVNNYARDQKCWPGDNDYEDAMALIEAAARARAAAQGAGLEAARAALARIDSYPPETSEEWATRVAPSMVASATAEDRETRSAAQGAGAQPVAWEWTSPDSDKLFWVERCDVSDDQRRWGWTSRPLYAAPPDAPRPDIEAARREERERCAKLAETSLISRRGGQSIAEAIRALGDQP